MALQDEGSLYFYELHEADDELYTDVVLAHDSEFDENEFLALVLDARSQVLERFEQDSLIEAVAARLGEQHGFLVIDDSSLRVAVNVSANEGETGVVAVEERRETGTEEDDGFRSLLVDVDTEASRWGDP